MNQPPHGGKNFRNHEGLAEEMDQPRCEERGNLLLINEVAEDQHWRRWKGSGVGRRSRVPRIGARPSLKAPAGELSGARQCLYRGDFTALEKLAARLRAGAELERQLRVLCDRWVYQACLVHPMTLEEQARSGFAYHWSFYQIEYSRNLLFKRRPAALGRGTVVPEKPL